MTLTISLSPAVEAKLRELAAARGQEPTAYASKLVEDAVSRPSLREILDPVQTDFAQSGVSEAELMEMGRRELESMRRERREKTK